MCIFKHSPYWSNRVCPQYTCATGSFTWISKFLHTRRKANGQKKKEDEGSSDRLRRRRRGIIAVSGIIGLMPHNGDCWTVSHEQRKYQWQAKMQEVCAYVVTLWCFKKAVKVTTVAWPQLWCSPSVRVCVCIDALCQDVEPHCLLALYLLHVEFSYLLPSLHLLADLIWIHQFLTC